MLDNKLKKNNKLNFRQENSMRNISTCKWTMLMSCDRIKIKRNEREDQVF